MKHTHTLYIERYQKLDNKWTLQTTHKNEDYNLEKWQTYILDARNFFKNLGGTERLKGYTLTSISPCGTKKTVYTLKKNKGKERK